MGFEGVGEGLGVGVGEAGVGVGEVGVGVGKGGFCKSNKKFEAIAAAKTSEARVATMILFLIDSDLISPSASTKPQGLSKTESIIMSAGTIG